MKSGIFARGLLAVMLLVPWALSGCGEKDQPQSKPGTVSGEDVKKEAKEAFTIFSEAWKKRYPGVVKYWRENLQHLTVFMKYPEQVRSYIYTTNQLERINKEIRRRTKTIEIFSSEESMVSVLYLILKFDDEHYVKKRKDFVKGIRIFTGI